MVEELPTIRTMPVRRRYVPAGRRRRSPLRFLFAWIFGGVVGLAGGYAILIYGFDRDPLGVGGSLPRVSIEWPATAQSD